MTRKATCVLAVVVAMSVLAGCESRHTGGDIGGGAGGAAGGSGTLVVDPGRI